MRIRELTVHNIKILGDQTFSFVDADEEIRTWTALLGDNGMCKTTILQAIALAASGDRVARGLVEDASDYVRQDRLDDEAFIAAEFDTRTGPLSVRLTVRPGHHAFRGNEDAVKVDDIRDVREPGYLVLGYGTGRRLPRRGEVAIPRDPIVDRVEGLFDSSHKMLGVDFFEALEEQELATTYAWRIRNALTEQDVNGDSLLPRMINLELRGQSGVNTMAKLLESRRLLFDVGGDNPLRLAPHLLSQGYQSTFAWVADLLGHAFIDAQGDVDPAQLEGIVLLDEIDLHLHPTWQRRVVPLLRQVFPRMQFIVTTHSPLILTGFEANEIIGLELHDGAVVQRGYDEEPGLQTGTELMEEFFEVRAAGRPELLAAEREALELSVLDSPSPEQRARLIELEHKLAPYTSIEDEDPELAD